MKYLPIIVLAASILTGCQQSNNEGVTEMSTAQHLRINNQGDIASLHPHTGIDLQCRTFQKALFEGLTRINPTGEAELAGAEKIEISPSQDVYTFTLRPMQWTNGEAVTAEHYAAAWRAALAPDSSCLRPDLLYVIKNAEEAKKGEVALDEVGIRAPDARTLVVELAHPAPYFLNLVATPLFSPLYDKSEVPTVFNGPFTIDAWDHDKVLTLKKSATYWDQTNVRLEQIETSLVNDPSTAVMMYEKGEIDWVGHPFTMLPMDFIEKAEHSTDFATKPIAGVFWLSLNTEVFPLNNKKIRQALSIIIDRAELAEHVLMNETPTRSLLPQEVTLLTGTELYKDCDEKRAQILFDEGLAELNLTRESFPKLEYSYSDIPGQKKIAETIKQRWEQTFGIGVELQASEWNIFFANLGQRQYQVGGCIYFSAFHDATYTLDFFRDSAHRYNSSQWQSEHYTQLLDRADREPDPIARAEHLKEAERLLLEEMPVIPLYQVQAKYLKAPRVQSLYINDLGQADFKWAYVEETVTNRIAKR